jgi:DNA-directed RNA polymerase subunit RPC12/RpoP
MKPRTKQEHEIERLAKTMPPIIEKHIVQAKEKCYPPEAWQMGRDFGCFCTECGKEFDSEARDGEVICPHCGRTLTVLRTRRQHLKEYKMFAVVTVHQGWQVVRYIELWKQINRFGVHPIAFDWCEVAQVWINDEGESRARAVSISYNFYRSSFRYNTPLQIRQKEKTYDFIPSGVYSPQRILPVARRNGYDGHVGKDSPSFVIKLLLTNTYYETLYKAGYRQFLSDTKEINAIRLNWPSLKICMRQHYKPSDAGIWYDMMRNLRKLELDERNPHYVCPKDLRAMHDEMERRLTAKRNKEAEEKRRAELRKDQALLDKKHMYFGICFGNDKVKVTVLSSMYEYEEEGKKMHHCVFTNRYCAKKDSLILSAKDAKGERLATIELSLKSYKVIQCRAAFNKEPERYDEIVKLVESHAGAFRKAKMMEGATV